MKITTHQGECDNISNTHNPDVIEDTDAAQRVICKDCLHQYVIRKDWRGVADNVEYTKIFKRWILQGNDNLFYKHYDWHLKR